jgi:hypothetical protein
MRYRILVMPDLPMISLAALNKVRDLIQQGATVLMRTEPKQTTGLTHDDAKVHKIAAELWKTCGNHFGKGRLVCTGTARELLAADHIPPDFAFEQAPAGTIDYIHHTDHGAEVYFVSNQSSEPVQFPALFRVKGLTPELWDGVSGEIHKASYEATQDGGTRVSLNLAPYGSIYVVFRSTSTAPAMPGQATGQTPISGAWHVVFDSPAATPAERNFAALEDWAASNDPKLKYFSGHATYTKTIELPAGKHIALDLGQIGEIAEVWLNGQSLGTFWMPPFRIDFTKVAKPGPNELKIRITNLWINRLLGDALLPAGERTTKTNIKALPKVPPRPSGLIGPVTLLTW